MAIYKLKDLYIKKPQYGIGKKAQNEGKYYYVRQTDINIKKFPTRIDNGPLLNNDDILIARVGNAGDTYIHTSGKNHVFAGFLVRYNFNQNILLNKYFYYWTKTKKYKKQVLKLRTGAVQPNFNPNVACELVINVPNLKIQNKIIDIIEQNGKLFLSYPNCVRIDTYENAKLDMKNLIDIIEPIEKMIFKLKIMQNKINNFLLNLDIQELNEDNIFESIKTGKLNTNVIQTNGKYNFYTCGKKIMKSNCHAFHGRYILLSGNGELYVWWDKGQFDLYQRVYALKEKSDFFTTLLAIKKGIKKLRQRSNGAVIKFIKINDIHSVKMLANKHEQILQTLFSFERKIETLITVFANMQNKLVKLLIK